MLHIDIITVGKLKEKYLVQGVEEFLKRLKPYAKVEIVEVAEEKIPDNPSPGDVQKAIAKEGERLLAKVSPRSYVFALDLHGVELSSEQLAAKIEDLTTTNSSLSFIIGGAFGISPEVTARADFRLRFSKLTFTHQMIRLILVEQVYRAFKIIRNEKYHW